MKKRKRGERERDGTPRRSDLAVVERIKNGDERLEREREREEESKRKRKRRKERGRGKVERGTTIQNREMLAGIRNAAMFAIKAD